MIVFTFVPPSEPNRFLCCPPLVLLGDRGIPPESRLWRSSKILEFTFFI